MAGNEKLRAVCGSIIENFRSADKDYKEKYLGHNTPAYDKFNIGIAYTATDEKLKRAYKKLVALVPTEKKTELHAKIETYFRATFKTEASFTNMKKRILAKPELEEKEFYIFEAPTNNFFVEGDTNAVFDTILDYLDGVELDGVTEDLESYKAECEYNQEIYPWANEIEEIKKKNIETVADEQKLKELNEELDIIAKTVVTSPDEYTKSYELYENEVAHEQNLLTDEINDRQLESEQYRELNDYFRDNTVSNDVNYGVRHISDAHETDTNVAKEFLKEDRKFILPEDKKNALRNILKLMKERGMLDERILGESNDKTYSFNQIGTAQANLHDLIRSGSTDVGAIRHAREEYESALQNMRDVYKMIGEQLSPNENSAIGNLSSYRTSWVPNEFKNNIFINAYANAIYNLGAIMDEVGIDYDEMLDDPSEAFFKCIVHLSKKVTPNDVLKNAQPADAIGFANSYFQTKGYPLLAVGRQGEFLRQLTAGTEYYEQNTMALLLTATYDTRVFGLAQNGDYSSLFGFFVKGEKEQTAANMLLVNEEDRDYNKLRSFEAITVDGMEKIPPFNATEYLENHKVDPAKLIERLNDTVKRVYNREDKAGLIGRMAITVRAAQVAAYEFMLMHPTPDVEAKNAFFTKAQFNALKAIVNTPEKAFSKFMTKDLSEEKARYRSMSDYSKGIEHTGEAALKGTELSKAEKAYCQKIEDIKKTLTGKDAEAAISELLAKEIQRIENDEKAYSKELRDEMAKYEPMSAYIKNVERTGKDALKTAREEAREAEKAYGKQVDNIKRTLTGKDAESALADLRAKEIERLEQAYANGKLPSDYFEQRRFNVEQGKETKTVPFGASEQPSFSKFKKEHAEEFKDMSAEEMQTLYDRMMDNARRAENKFMLTAAGKQPKPTVERADPVEVKEIQNQREHIDVSNELKDNVVEVSKQIVHENPQLNITKNP